jgi:simple sugar transport system ATP-binding protein
LSEILRAENIVKRFGAVTALEGVSLRLDQGEVLGILGDNGAGKSTLMKCITGVYRSDAGEIWFDGQRRTVLHPRDSRALGIEMIYQDLALAGRQDVASNIFLGREPMWKVPGLPIRLIDWRRMEREAEAIVLRLGARIGSVRLRTDRLSGGQRQSVAIARALTFKPRLVIMDEPTAALAVREVNHVLELIRELRGQKIAVILISHRLTDVFEVSDRIVTLRQGEVVASEAVADTSMNRVVAHIVGAA